MAPGHDTRNGVRHGNTSLPTDSENGISQSPSYFENEHEGKGDDNKVDTLSKCMNDVLVSPNKEIPSPVGDENKIEDVADGQSNSRSFDEDMPPSSPPSHSKPNTPSTAERRKLYEKRISTGVPDVECEDGDDKLEDFERASVQRTSIAERRRLYENRSVSVQDPGATDKRSPTLSPTPLRRRDSFKGSKGSGGETTEGSKKPPVAMQRQVSQEGKAQPAQEKKPEPVTTPTPKRTSTVFGK